MIDGAALNISFVYLENDATQSKNIFLSSSLTEAHILDVFFFSWLVFYIIAFWHVYLWLEPISTEIRNKHFNNLILFGDFMSLNEKDTAVFCSSSLLSRLFVVAVCVFVGVFFLFHGLA